MLFYFEISNLNMLCCLYCWLMKFLGVLDYLCFRYPRVWIWSWIITQTDFRVGFRFRFGLWIVGLVPWHYILSEFNPLPSSNSHDMTHNKFLLFIFHIFFSVLLHVFLIPWVSLTMPDRLTSWKAWCHCSVDGEESRTPPNGKRTQHPKRYY